MLLLAAILTMVGAGDILRVLLAGRIGAAGRGGALAGLCAAVLLTLVAFSPWWLAVLTLVPTVVWFLSVPVSSETPLSGSRRSAVRTRLPWVAAFLFLTAMVTLVGDTVLAETGGPRVESIGRFNVEFLMLAGGVGLFLVVSANGLVRIALDTEQHPAEDGQAQLVVSPPQLKGGRWIGPLERIALTGLLLAGAFPVAAGLIAAKGIVRFPEMHQDREQGNKAEYFLVGSFVSWTVAILAAGLLFTTF